MKHHFWARLSVACISVLLPATALGAGMMCVDDSGHSILFSHAGDDGGQYKLALDPSASGNTVVRPGTTTWPITDTPLPKTTANRTGLFGFLYELPGRVLGTSTEKNAAPTIIHLTGGTISSSMQTQSSGGTSETPARTQSTLLQNLIAYWKLDEISGNGIAIGAGKYLSIDGASAASPHITGDLTLSCWVKFASQPSDLYPILSKWGSTADDDSYRLAYQGGGTKYLIFGTNGSANEQVAAPFTLQNGEWYHIIATASDTIGTIYVNGQSIGSGPASRLKNANSTPFGLGYQVGYSLVGDQEQDECGVWSRALTQEEVTELYHAGHGNTYPF